jgi:hypothetical protein
MDVERGALLVGRECTAEVEEDLSIMASLLELKHLAGMSVFQSQAGGKFLIHGRFRSQGLPRRLGVHFG